MSQETPKVALVCGTAAPLRCGVEDYTNRLAEALALAGAPVLQLGGKNWGITSVRRQLHTAKAEGCDLIHIQYPAIGFGATLAPHFMGVLTSVPVLVTLHEFSLVHSLRKWSCALFSLGTHHLVFTTADERRAFGRSFPWYRAKATVIPIGSNIPFLSRDAPPEPVIVFFGHIKPNRSVEQVIAVADLARVAGRPYRFRIIGSPAPGAAAYLNSLRWKADGLPIDWMLDLQPELVAEQFQQAAAAYLPYPDGASERRGSLLAALGNGVPVVTTDGPLCPPRLRQALRFAPDSAAALQQLDAIMRDPAIAQTLSLRAREVVHDFQWPAIAAAHRDLYRTIARGGARGGVMAARRPP